MNCFKCCLILINNANGMTSSYILLMYIRYYRILKPKQANWFYINSSNLAVNAKNKISHKFSDVICWIIFYSVDKNVWSAPEKIFQEICDNLVYYSILFDRGFLLHIFTVLSEQLICNFLKYMHLSSIFLISFFRYMYISKYTHISMSLFGKIGSCINCHLVWNAWSEMHDFVIFQTQFFFSFWPFIHFHWVPWV